MKVLPESRAEYFRELRKKKKQIVFLLENEKAEKLDQILKNRGEGRTEWFRRKVDEELKEE
jgi:hypothetical protein